MKATTLKRFVYVFMAVIILAIVVFFIPPPLPEAETETDYSLKYDELTETQLQTLRVLAQDEVNSYLSDEQEPLSYAYEKHIRDFVDNDYIIYCFNPRGYVIYSLINSDFVEINPLGNSPYGRNSKDAYYVPMVGYYEKTNSNTARDLMSNEKFSFQSEEVEALAEVSRMTEKASREHTQLKTFHKIRAAKTRLSDETKKRIEEEPILSGANLDETVMIKEASNIDGSDYTVLYTIDDFFQADFEVPHSFYFKNNFNRFAFEDGGSCGYNALAMVLVYHELFSCTGYLSEQESAKFITQEGGLIAPPVVADALVPYVRHGAAKNSTAYDMSPATSTFLNGKSVSCLAYTRTLYTFDIIEKNIKEGNPIILFGAYPNFHGELVAHAVVAYGKYDDERVLVHYGWDGYSQVIISPYFTGGLYIIINQSEHKHNYKYFCINGKQYCGCGKVKPTVSGC